MKELIEAFQIFLKYKNVDFPTHCEHDIMYIIGIDPDEVSKEDKEKLKQLGFNCGHLSGENTFYSLKYGSA